MCLLYWGTTLQLQGFCWQFWPDFCFLLFCVLRLPATGSHGVTLVLFLLSFCLSVLWTVTWFFLQFCEVTCLFVWFCSHLLGRRQHDDVHVQHGSPLPNPPCYYGLAFSTLSLANTGFWSKLLGILWALGCITLDCDLAELWKTLEFYCVVRTRDIPAVSCTYHSSSFKFLYPLLEEVYF